MKKILALTLMLICLVCLFGCDNKVTVSSVEVVVSKDYGKVIADAKAEFAEIFKKFENLQITETSTMARTDDAEEIIVQFKYSSNNGNGVYGFLYNLDDYANPELVQHGEDITIENLIG